MLPSWSIMELLGDLLEAGSHEWQAGENAWLFEKGGVKGTWDQFKNRFSFGGQVVTQQEIIFADATFRNN